MEQLQKMRYFSGMESWKHILCGVLFAAFGLASAPVAVGQSVISTGESFIRGSLLAGRTQPDGSRMAGLMLDVAPQWKTYWRSPGSAGVPPPFDWSRSRNVESIEVFWPRPKFFESYGLSTIGYSGRVVFPLRLVPKDPSAPMELGLDVAIGVCRDICVLEETALALHIAPGSADIDAGLVAAAEAKVPRPGAEQGLIEASCRIAGTGAKRRFDAVLDFGRQLDDPAVILEGPALSWFSDIEVTTQDDRILVSAKMSLLDDSVWVERSQVRMTVLAGSLAADIQGCTGLAG